MRKILLMLAVTMVSGAALAQGSDVLKQGVMDRLVKQTGVYNKGSGATVPSFVADPAWPQHLPNNWLLGQVAGLYVDRHDTVWISNRPRTMTNDEAALDTAGMVGGKNGLGFDRANGPLADCCNAAPSVMQFDSSGKLLRAWAGWKRSARSKRGASGPTASTASMSTITTTSISRAMAASR